ncbi:MAG TPA: hypothetical protein VM755_19770 [Stellaceae bacterium]|nr:hypothetical protein [Stellaceae bacterium]
MARGPTTFRQRDVTAAVKAVEAAGYKVERVEIDKVGKIVVVTTEGARMVRETADKNEWDAI